MAKMATTIDHLSGGRLEFGLGASGAEAEHAMLGIPFYTAGERIRRRRGADRLPQAVDRGPRVLRRPLFHTHRRHLQPEAAAAALPVHLGRRRGRETDVAGRRGARRCVGRDRLGRGGRAQGFRPRSALRRRLPRPAEIKRSVQPRFDPADPAAMVDLLHAYIEAGFTENIIYVPPGDEPVRTAEIAAERVLPEIVGHRA